MAIASTRYKGTSARDLFELDELQLASAQISGGAGTDTLSLSTDGDYSFSSASYKGLSGIDVIDFSGHTSGTLEIRLSSSMMSQSDAGRLTIVSGASGIDLLKAGSSVGGSVYVDGIGDVRLDNATNNVVNISDGATVHVVGGNGSDTIRASQTGSILDGGAGNDTLVAGNGTDTVRFGIGDRADLVQGFNVAQDVVVLEGTSFTHMSQLLLCLTDTVSGARLDLGDGDTLTFTGVAVSDLAATNFAGIAAGSPTIVGLPGTTADQLQTLLDGAGPGATVILAEGQHVFDHAIQIRHDGVTLRGASETGTVVVFDYPVGTGGDGIVVRAAAETYLGTGRHRQGRDVVHHEQRRGPRGRRHHPPLSGQRRGLSRGQRLVQCQCCSAGESSIPRGHRRNRSYRREHGLSEELDPLCDVR
jgi:RTX calcium-binding nonapeptide repeat (4 copies)